jgi:hypothetical protein
MEENKLDYYYKKYANKSYTFRSVLNSKVDFSKKDWQNKLCEVVNFYNPKAAHDFVKNNMPDFYNECCYNDNNALINIKDIINLVGISIHEKNWDKKVFNIIKNYDNTIITPLQAFSWLKYNMPEFYGNKKELLHKTDVRSKNSLNKLRIEMIKNLSDGFILQSDALDSISVIISMSRDDARSWMLKNITNSAKKTTTNNYMFVDKNEFIKNTGIDFSKENWNELLCKRFSNETPESIKEYVKNNMPDFYNECCFNENTIINNKRNVVLNSKVNFSNRNWHIELSKVMNNTPEEAYNFVKDNMESLYKRAFKDDRYGEDGILSIANQLQIIVNSGINLFDKNCNKRIGELLNISYNEVYNLTTKHLLLNEKLKTIPKGNIIKEDIIPNEQLIELNRKNIENCSRYYKSNSSEEIQTFINRKELMIESGINYTKENWANLLAEKLNMNYLDIYYWVKKNMNIFFTNYCYHYDEENYNVIQYKKNIIDNSNIDFSKYGWDSELSKLFTTTQRKTHEWVRDNLPDFYRNNCFKYTNGSNRSDEIRRRLQVMKQNNVSFHSSECIPKIAKLFNISVLSAKNFIKECKTYVPAEKLV